VKLIITPNALKVTRIINKIYKTCRFHVSNISLKAPLVNIVGSNMTTVMFYSAVKNCKYSAMELLLAIRGNVNIYIQAILLWYSLSTKFIRRTLLIYWSSIAYEFSIFSSDKGAEKFNGENMSS
jgi:hypothetical protein